MQIKSLATLGQTRVMYGFLGNFSGLYISLNNIQNSRFTDKQKFLSDSFVIYGAFRSKTFLLEVTKYSKPKHRTSLITKIICKIKGPRTTLQFEVCLRRVKM